MLFVAWAIALQSLAFAGVQGKTLVRREAKVKHVEEEDHVTPNIKAGLKQVEDEEDHVTHSVKALFLLTDLDKDGKITMAEVAKLKETLGQGQLHMPALPALLELSAEGGTGISFAEFNKEAHRHASDSVLQQITKHDAVHRHQRSSNSNVSCGAHKAENCEACTTTDSAGETVADHYAEWCHGDCVYNPADSKCHLKGTVTVSGTHTMRSQHTTTPPDLLNPNSTAIDEEMVEKGAQAAIREEKREAEEKEEKKEEEKKFNWGNFWVILAIAACSVIFICCVSTTVAAVVIMSAKPGKTSEETDGETDAGTDAGDDEESIASVG